ncbi:MAG: hypothetical protein HN919_21930 [Verrucomicrobia bacterium]|nr:hypothetical protein [Verrucomicrobiota bacterium]
MNAAVCAQLCVAAPLQTESRKGHKTYDFFYDARYPGYRRSDVGVDKVSQEGDGDLKIYHKRKVDWWPKRGIDIVPLEDIPGAPLRTWTTKTDIPANYYMETLPRGQFKAHLVGFRGVGDRYPMDPKDPDSFHCPAVVLRLADGRKRIFLGKYFTPEDRQYIIKIYVKECERVAKTLLQDEYPPAGETAGFPLGEEHLYKPGRVRFDSQHFSVKSGAQSPTDRAASHWINVKKQAETQAMRNHYMTQLENFWAYMEYAGCHMRFWKSARMQKYTITPGGTMYDGYRVVGTERGGGGGGYGGCTTGGPWIEIVFHEWGHGMETAKILSLGGGETGADGCAIMANPAVVQKTGHQMLKPWKNLFHGAYPGTGGYEMLADNPNWGYATVPALLSLASDEDLTPMHILAHLGEERGIWAEGEGIRGMGDLMGQIGARFAELDCQQEYQLRGWYGSPKFSCLIPVDTDKSLYRCPPYEAPEPFGVNISRLVADKDATEITVDFRGQFDPETYSDWRACIVAVGQDSTCRYTPLWNKGKMTMNVEPGDRRYWLTVTATPSALLESACTLYQGAFAFRYPYEVVLSNCRPGRSLGLIAKDGAYKLGLYDRHRAHDLSLLPGEAAHKTFIESLRKVAAAAEQAMEDEGLLTKDVRSAKDDRRIATLRSRMARADMVLSDLGGHPHPNGGGWVSKTSFAAPSAYVGPGCMVIGGAQVLDNASLVNGAMAMGEGAVVKDHAKLSGKGAIIGLVEAGGYARVIRPIANHITPHMDKLSVKTTIAPVVPMRIKELSANGLFANYDCRRPETVLFEDCLKERKSGPFYLGFHTEGKEVFFDGLLVGKPGFEALGRADGALIFDGKTQYAEADAAVADLGAIRVVLRLRPASAKGAQTLFDFGSDSAHRFALVLRDGKPSLEWTVAGKSDKAAAPAPLKAGRWAELRVEIDGRSAAVFVDDKKVASKATAFRPADAYVPGLGRRNYVFRARDDAQPSYAAGALDYMRIYFEVAEDFAALPPAPLISPVKAMPEVLKMEQELFGDWKSRAEVYKDLMSQSTMSSKLQSHNDRVENRFRRYELGEDEKTIAATLALRKKTERLEADIEAKRKTLKTEFDGRKRAPATQQAPRQETQKRISELDKQLPALREAIQKEKVDADAAWEAKVARIKASEAYAAYEKDLPVAEAERKRQEKISRESGEAAKVIAEAIKKEVQAANPGVDEQIKELERKIAERKRVVPAERHVADPKLPQLENKLAETKRTIDALVADHLLEHEAYIEAAVKARYAQSLSRNKRRESPIKRPKEEPAARAAHDAVVAEINALRKQSQGKSSGESFEAYARKKVGPMEEELGNLKKELTDTLRRNALNYRPDEYRVHKDSIYKRRCLSGRHNQLWEKGGELLAGPTAPDDLGQLEGAIRDQGRWHTTCDWDTMNKWEKKYDTLNPRLQGWLRRAKPYRYPRMTPHDL